MLPARRNIFVVSSSIICDWFKKFAKYAPGLKIHRYYGKYLGPDNRFLQKRDFQKGGRFDVDIPGGNGKIILSTSVQMHLQHPPTPFEKLRGAANNKRLVRYSPVPELPKTHRRRPRQNWRVWMLVLIVPSSMKPTGSKGDETSQIRLNRRIESRKSIRLHGISIPKPFERR